jgi:hypothetical protein
MAFGSMRWRQERSTLSGCSGCRRSRSGLVTYTLATKWQAGAMPALLFAVAMGLHLFATDHGLAEHFPVRLTGRWRFVLAGGALTGWLVAVASSPQDLC